MDLARLPSFRQSLRVRWLGFLVVLVSASSASAGPTSNPSFLGIEMSDMGGACVIQSVTRCSPAQDAGLRFGNLIVAIDGQSISATMRSPCDLLRDRIMAHTPGDATSFEVRRGGEVATIKAVLSTRADVQHRCFVDQPLASISVTDIDNPKHEITLDEARGRTTVIGFFRLSYCNGCGKLFDRVADGIAKRLADAETPPRVLGVTMQDDDRPMPTRAGFGSTVPLAVASRSDFEEVTLKERDRVQFMVVDSRGIVRFVTPIAPDSDDVEAAIDEVLAAAQQAEHARTQRR